MAEQDYTIVEVVNRTDEEVVWMYDGREYKLKPHQKKPMIQAAAEHGYIKTMYKYDPITSDTKHRLGIVGVHDLSDVKITEDEKTELIDRTNGGLFGGEVAPQRFGNPVEKPVRTASGGHSVTGSETVTMDGKTAGADAKPAVGLKVDESEFAEE